MGKVKNWAMDNAENFLSNLESQIKSGAQTITSAMLLVNSADIAWDLIGFNHIDEVKEYDTALDYAGSIDYETENGDQYWAYFSQIEKDI